MLVTESKEPLVFYIKPRSCCQEPGRISHQSIMRQAPSPQPVSLSIICLSLPSLPRQLQQKVGSKQPPSIAGLMPALQAVTVCPGQEGREGGKGGGPGYLSTYQL